MKAYVDMSAALAAADAVIGSRKTRSATVSRLLGGDHNGAYVVFAFGTAKVLTLATKDGAVLAEPLRVLRQPAVKSGTGAIVSFDLAESESEDQ